MTHRDILVSSALPYANGPIHLGHVLEYVQTDIWVRFQKSRGHHCIFVCAADAHGTPTMLKARELGIEPEALVTEVAAGHARDFAGFQIELDNFHTTHSPENEEITADVYRRLEAAGHIYTRNIVQAYDEAEGMFLPDRFVRGTCPVCGTPDQYGDSCENCGSTYSPADLVDPVSALSGEPPVQRESEHYFFRLSDFSDYLRQWIAEVELDESVARKLEEWFERGLEDWDISRDAPYFGFLIPGTTDKYFYVWLDAPVGYLASFKHYCEREGLDYERWMRPDTGTELHHFIGKDIIYFHALFWPAVLRGAGYRAPSGVHAHGFLTVNGEKMSKSRGTFVMARTYLDHLKPDYLRYYYAAKLGPGIDDIDLNLEDFVARVNSDLVGKLVNIASRCAGFISKRFDGRLGATLEDAALHAEFVAAGEEIAAHYERREYSKAVRAVMTLADRANRYIDERKPWVLAKDAARLPEVQAVCTEGLNLFRVLMIYLAPVLPALAGRARALFGESEWRWASAAEPLLDSPVAAYQALITRIDEAAVAAMIEASKNGG